MTFSVISFKAREKEFFCKGSFAIQTVKNSRASLSTIFLFAEKSILETFLALLSCYHLEKQKNSQSRTPLNAILGFATVLKVTDNPEERKELIDIINSSCDMLQRLINDILEASSITKNLPTTIKPEPIDFVREFENIGFMVEHRVKQANLEFIREKPYDNFYTTIDIGRVQHVVLNVATILDEGGIDVAGCKVDDVEAVLQIVHDANYLVVLLFLLEHGDKLRHAERRDIEPLARQQVEVVQAGLVLLEAGVTAIATHQDIGVHEDVVGIEVARLVRHRSEYQVRELFLLLIGQNVRPTGSPHAYEVVYELLACQSVLLQEQFEHALALLFD